MSCVGVIGGSGLYNLEGIEKIDEVSFSTPFGSPSDSFVICKLEDRKIVFLPRHGKFHQISPTKINYRANIYGMKKLGVDKIISLSACGSLKEEIKPLDFVIPDQFIDRTNNARKYTFFDDGIVAHISFAHPICRSLSETLKESVDSLGIKVHKGGIYLNMEGPQFSTLAESNLYRQWGMDIIGMTNMAEARLAREAEICYVTLAAVTDYDCWHPDHENVTLDLVLSNLKKNVSRAKSILREFLVRVDTSSECKCSETLRYAIVTSSEQISPKTKKNLDIIIGKYI